MYYFSATEVDNIIKSILDRSQKIVHSDVLNMFARRMGVHSWVHLPTQYNYINRKNKLKFSKVEIKAFAQRYISENKNKRQNRTDILTMLNLPIDQSITDYIKEKEEKELAELMARADAALVMAELGIIKSDREWYRQLDEQLAHEYTAIDYVTDFKIEKDEEERKNSCRPCPTCGEDDILIWEDFMYCEECGTKVRGKNFVETWNLLTNNERPLNDLGIKACPICQSHEKIKIVDSYSRFNLHGEENSDYEAKCDSSSREFEPCEHHPNYKNCDCDWGPLLEVGCPGCISADSAKTREEAIANWNRVTACADKRRKLV